ncbi:HAMP domain-containing histidine kinase [bacterium]|nr:HAMP domain-containing histidine kinase [bacterium]
MLYVYTIIFLFVCLQYSLIKKYKDLSEKEKSLIASVSHDLRSPTAAQINMLNLLLKGNFGKLTSEQYEMIKLTYSSSEYISNLLSTVLTSYKGDCHCLKLKKTKFDISESIIRICEENKCLSDEKGQKIIFNCSVQTIAYGDKLQICRVILNIISNAITYGLKNSTINVNLAQNNDCVEFSVTNKTHPIPEKELKNIFNKFAKTTNSKFNKYSNGLGLYTSKMIIDLHKGTIFANSTPDGIFTIGFKLPDKNTKYRRLSLPISKIHCF